MTITESNVTIMVKDMDKAIAFYQSIGFSIKQRWDNHYAMLTATGITLGVHPSDGKGLGSGTLSIGLMVDDIKEAVRQLDQHKIKHEEVIDGDSGIYLHFKDLDGTRFYFVKPKWR